MTMLYHLHLQAPRTVCQSAHLQTTENHGNLKTIPEFGTGSMALWTEQAVAMRTKPHTPANLHHQMHISSTMLLITTPICFALSLWGFMLRAALGKQIAGGSDLYNKMCLHGFRNLTWSCMIFTVTIVWEKMVLTGLSILLSSTSRSLTTSLMPVST